MRRCLANRPDLPMSRQLTFSAAVSAAVMALFALAMAPGASAPAPGDTANAPFALGAALD